MAHLSRFVHPPNELRGSLCLDQGTQSRAGGLEQWTGPDTSRNPPTPLCASNSVELGDEKSMEGLSRAHTAPRPAARQAVQLAFPWHINPLYVGHNSSMRMRHTQPLF